MARLQKDELIALMESVTIRRPTSARSLLFQVISEIGAESGFIGVTTRTAFLQVGTTVFWNWCLRKALLIAYQSGSHQH